ncbi:MAG: hypothetical protein KDB21_03805 [Acidimicrobiales bacterium]|nr:hypothetical protein [Acidimicrobiales bacterium]
MTTRGRALVRQLVGVDGATNIAASTAWPAARELVAATFYGREMEADADRRDARASALAGTAWQLRVLSGWLPPGRSVLCRLGGGPIEISNITGRLDSVDGATRAPLIPLGSLAGISVRALRSGSPDQLRRGLAASVWGDPRSVVREAIIFHLRAAWLARIARSAPWASRWSSGAAAVLIARERFSFGREPAEPAARLIDELVGARWRRVEHLEELALRLPRVASWAIDGIASSSELWLAEIRVARAIAEDAQTWVASGAHSERAATGIVALLLLDLRRTLAAIDLAATGPFSPEVLDAMA